MLSKLFVRTKVIFLNYPLAPSAVGITVYGRPSKLLVRSLYNQIVRRDVCATHYHHYKLPNEFDFSQQ